MILSEFLVMHVAGLNFKYIVVFVSGSKDLKFSNQTYLYFFRYKKQHLCVDASKSYGMARRINNSEHRYSKVRQEIFHKCLLVNYSLVKK